MALDAGEVDDADDDQEWFETKLYWVSGGLLEHVEIHRGERGLTYVLPDALAQMLSV